MKSLKGELLGKTHCLSVHLIYSDLNIRLPHRWYKRPMIGPSIETKTGGNVGLAGGPDLGFCFPWNGGIPRPHQVTWSQPINMCLARKREPIRGKLKSPPMPKFEKSPQRFGPIKLLCKHVTNLLQPATNCLCTPYKLGNSLGSALSDPVPLRCTCGGSPDSSQQLNFPFFAGK